MPHMIRLWTNQPISKNYVLTFLVGAIFVLWCDNIARCLFTIELPISIVTSFFGALYLAIIFRRGKKGHMIRLENIRYHSILSNIDLHLEKGKIVMLLGENGCGKTTLIKLLMRFYDVNGGCIKVDGHDIREFKRSDLREMFGMVLQDTWLYNASIRDNICYGKLDASEEEIQGAARAAYAQSFH